MNSLNCALGRSAAGIRLTRILFATAAFATAALAGCALDASRRIEGPAEIRLAPQTRLELARDLVFLPPAEGMKLMHLMGERPGAEVLGVVLAHADTPVPRVLVIFAPSRDAQGVPALELVGWDEAPEARSYIEELLLALRDRGPR